MHVGWLHSALALGAFSDPSDQDRGAWGKGKGKGKGKVHTFEIAPLRSESPAQKRSGMARVLKGFHSFTCTPWTNFVATRWASSWTRRPLGPLASSGSSSWIRCGRTWYVTWYVTPTRSSAIGISHTCLCLPSRSWYSFTDPGGMEGWVDLGAK